MASPFQLAGQGRGLKLELDAEIRSYVERLEAYREDLKRWNDFGRVLTRPIPPVVPYYLDLWFELRRWPGSLLVEGGLLDQPAWTWHLVDLAGRIYQDILEQNQALLPEEPRDE